VTAEPVGALDGVRIIDFTRVLAGPYATMLLADLGAEVVKVERPGTGDETRAWGPPWFEGEATYFLAVNRNKTSITLDLADASDRAKALERIAASDVLVENFRPGTMDRLGLGYDQLKQNNPRLVYCSITGFGARQGAHLPGYDLIVQAAGGLMSITGDQQSGPVKAGVALVDVITGLHAAVGVQAALRHRERTGHGQLVEVNLLSSLLSALTSQASSYLLTGALPRAMGNGHPSIAPYELVNTADRPLAVAAANNKLFAALAEAIGLPELVTDPRFASNADRVAHRGLLIAELEGVLRNAPADHWFKLLTQVGVPCAPINDIGQAFALAAELGLDPVWYAETEDRAAGATGTRVAQVRNPIRLSRTPAAYRTSPPPLTPGE
jgi:crotonobetainyl-CoA:carnitine CoA-transferase CaiB-like acyl-CoA transferase